MKFLLETHVYVLRTFTDTTMHADNAHLALLSIMPKMVAFALPMVKHLTLLAIGATQYNAQPIKSILETDVSVPTILFSITMSVDNVPPTPKLTKTRIPAPAKMASLLMLPKILV